MMRGTRHAAAVEGFRIQECSARGVKYGVNPRWTAVLLPLACNSLPERRESGGEPAARGKATAASTCGRPVVPAPG